MVVSMTMIGDESGGGGCRTVLVLEGVGAVAMVDGARWQVPPCVEGERRKEERVTNKGGEVSYPTHSNPTSPQGQIYTNE